MNSVNILGRITHELEIRKTSGEHFVLRFSIAVPKKYCKPGEERQSDFFNCVAWNGTAEFINKYFSKGRMIGITGELSNNVYIDKYNQKRVNTEILVTDVSFTGEEKETSQSIPPEMGDPNDFAEIPEPPYPPVQDYPMGDEMI